MAVSALPRMQELNPYVTVSADERRVETLPDEFFGKFQVVLIGSNMSASEALRISAAARKAAQGTLLFLSGSFGIEGWFVADLGEAFNYTKEGSAEVVSKSYPSIASVLSARWGDELQARHTALPLTFIKARLLSLYRGNQAQESGWSLLLPMRTTLPPSH